MIKQIDNDCFKVEVPERMNRYELQKLADDINITLMAIEQQELVEGAPTVFERGEECAS